LSGAGSVVMRRGGPPLDSIVQTSQFPSSPWESNAIVRPSGDHRGEPSQRPGPWVSGVGFEPSAPATQISFRSPPRLDSKAIRSPSGE
jgi:hypothetical protein